MDFAGKSVGTDRPGSNPVGMDAPGAGGPSDQAATTAPDSSIAGRVEQVLAELAEAGGIRDGHIVVIGASTSEVAGRRIGTAGSREIAAQIWQGVERVRDRYRFFAAYQCCEHLNRALVVERELLERHPGLVEVAAVPHPKAGGAMAAHAYRMMKDPCLVETIEAHAGLDIGDTLIGMHLRRVAVPFRPSVGRIGEAHVTAARTRPKYIGGPRAKYDLEPPDEGETAEPGADCSF